MPLPADPEILNGIEWTEALDEAFLENKRSDPDIYWQSFGSQDGFMRFYPAARSVLTPNDFIRLIHAILARSVVRVTPTHS